jgi:hypothetical protein
MALSKIDRAWSAYYQLRYPRDVQLAGDQERERTTDYLALAHSQGYIDSEQFTKRVDLALGARYRHELAWAEDGLPAGIKPQPKPQPPPGTVDAANRVITAALVALSFTAIIIGISVIVAITWAIH